MSEKQRRQFTAEQKVAIIKQHLVDKVPVSDLCEQHQILATQFYQWQKQLFQNGASAFERTKKKAANRPAAEQRRIDSCCDLSRANSAREVAQKRLKSPAQRRQRTSFHSVTEVQVNEDAWEGQAWDRHQLQGAEGVSVPVARKRRCDRELAELYRGSNPEAAHLADPQAVRDAGAS